MSLTRELVVAVVVAAFAAGFAARGFFAAEPVAYAQAPQRVFEIRTYTASPGKLEALKSRFRDHTIRLFQRHGITSIGYWVPQDAPESSNTLTYIIAHPSREAAVKNWAEFRADPEWVKAKAASEADGSLTTGMTSVFLLPTDFSQIK